MSREDGSLTVLDRLSAPLVQFMDRYYPNLPLFIVIITLLTMTLTWLFTGYTPVKMLISWGDSLSDILAFSMQISLTVMISHVLAHTDAVQRGLRRLSLIPRTTTQAYCAAVLIPALVCVVSWPLGLIAGGIVARGIAEAAPQRGLRLHFPLLVAGAFAGNTIWHMGYSASAPLFVATSNNPMMNLLGGVIPMGETVFTVSNISLAILTTAALCWLCVRMAPPTDRITEAEVDTLQADEASVRPAPSIRPVERWEKSRFFSALTGCGLVAYLLFMGIERGFDLNLNVVNWSFLAAALLLTRSLAHFFELIQRAALAAAPLIMAYPFYAGIIGIMTDSGFVTQMSHWFASVSSAETLPIWAFLSATVVNLFIPSGGAQWIVQGPVFIEAAQSLGVPLPRIVMAIAYGDQLTNLLQPLPALPLLALAGLELKHIMGFMVLFCAAGFVVLGGGITVLSLLT